MRHSILIVDDNAMIRQIYRQILSRANYNVLEASDGQKALDVFNDSSSNVEFVITDLEMPNMDGLGLAQSLRKLSSTLPILLVTANDEALIDFSRRESYRVFTSVLAKPVTVESLLRQIKFPLPKQEYDVSLTEQDGQNR